MKQESFRLQPTALWVIAAPVLGCMWLAAVNYANNLVYAVLYLIVSLSLISIFHTWRNLAGLQLEHIRIHPAFAGEEVRLSIYLRNSTKHVIYGIQFARLDEEAGWGRRLKELRSPTSGGMRISAGDSCEVEIQIPFARAKQRKLWGILTRPDLFVPTQRGFYRLETLMVRSAYPFGLFWANVRVPVNQDYYIYPQPKGSEELPGLLAGNEQGAPSSNRPGDDFSGVRAYVPGESLRHVDWKAFARGRPLSVKQFTGGAGFELWLDADKMGNVPLEKRLSQLALWIVTAEKAEVPYALRLGRTMLPMGLGEIHSRRALEALAVAGVGQA